MEKTKAIAPVISPNAYPTFAKMVAKSFQEVVNAEKVFVTDVDGEALYLHYLNSFPAGTNPIFKKLTEHECSTCRHFVKRAGNVVSVSDQGAVRTIWDEAAKKAPYPYDIVASALQEIVKAAFIFDIYRVGQKEASFGAATSHSNAVDEKGNFVKVLTWKHFYTDEIPKTLRSATPDKDRGDYKTTVQVFTRGLTELAPEALETVLGLIDAKSIYRGDEFRPLIVAFMKVQKAFLGKGERAQNALVWTSDHGAVARLRNTAIGKLVQDLTDGVDLEGAVKSYEHMVAPTNYKRSTSLITAQMVKDAMKTIEELGLESALERRFADIGDISVKDVRWVDGSVKPAMKGGLEGLLMKVASSAPKSTAKDEERAEEIKIDDFIEKILPTATGVEVLFKGEHLPNLMSITAPVHPEPKQLFKWSNDFAWSYTGNVADSYLRKQVQSLGGRVDGVLRFSHMWNHEKRNASLMDLHVFMPGSSAHRDGQHDLYPGMDRVGWNQRNHRASGGTQDVDYTDAAPEGYVPVENITFPSIDKLKEGQYTFKIHNWQKRAPNLGGFRAEIEFAGNLFQYDHPEPLEHKEWIAVAVATLKNGVFTIDHKHPVGTASQNAWGLKTEQYVKVNAITLSPNFWGDNAWGNKHTFFLLHGAKNDEPTRGIYNEFLSADLEKHRKVFEVIADKTKCQPTEGQLSGLGFSSTKKTNFLVKVQQGAKRRLFNVHVGT